ncbi:MAG: zinc ribbon domain-containing protein [Dehalococcoidia bacterium]|nr:zinc ribbon domain-containing protein [Dehalococcoidia bacterium]
MTENNFGELLAAAEAEAKAVACQRLEILTMIGEKALPDVRHKSDFAALVLRLGETEKQADELTSRVAKIREEQRLFERTEKMRLAKYTCVACKKVNDESARFCEECGKTVGELPREFCNACCTMNQQGMKFCGECGEKLAGATQ